MPKLCSKIFSNLHQIMFFGGPPMFRLVKSPEKSLVNALPERRCGRGQDDGAMAALSVARLFHRRDNLLPGAAFAIHIRAASRTGFFSQKRKENCCYPALDTPKHGNHQWLPVTNNTGGSHGQAELWGTGFFLSPPPKSGPLGAIFKNSRRFTPKKYTRDPPGGLLTEKMPGGESWHKHT